MQLAHKNPTLFHMLVVTWSVSWLVILPLFHVHALDVQEIPLRSNSFLAHTVFSGDLPGEYAPLGQHLTTSDSQSTVEKHYPQYSEIEFAVFHEDTHSLTRGSECQSEFLDQWKRHQLLLSKPDGALPIKIGASPLRIYLCAIPSRSPPTF